MWHQEIKSTTRNLVRVENVIGYEIYQWQNYSTMFKSTHIHCYLLDKRHTKETLFHTKPLSKDFLTKLETNREISNLFSLLKQYNKIKVDDRKVFNMLYKFIHL